MRASDETWNKLVGEGFNRGPFQMCPESEVLRSAAGELIPNGAGAGAESSFPYVGQITLLEVPDDVERNVCL